MLPTNLIRVFAWAAILSGVFTIIKKTAIELLLPPHAATNVVGTLGLLLGFFALTGVYLYQREESGRWGLISYIVIWFGLGAASGSDYVKNYVLLYLSSSELQALLASPTRVVLVSSFLAFLIGVVFFSIAMFRARKFPRLAIVLFLVGFVLYSLTAFLPDIVARTGQLFGAIGSIWIGYTMWAASRQTQLTAQPASV